MKEPAALAVLVVGADALARGGLRALLGAAPALRVVGHCEEAELEARLALDAVDVVLWDAAAVEGEVPEIAGALPVLALAVDAEAAGAALLAGAAGVVARSAPAERLVAALGAVAAELRVTDPALGPIEAEPRGDAPEVALTEREREVLDLLAQGLSNPEIGERLGVSAHTARFHVRAILEKLGAESRTEAVVLAIRAGLLAL